MALARLIDEYVGRGFLRWYEHPQLGRIVLPNSPIGFPELGRTELTPYPDLGQHNDAVYGGLLGIDADARAALHAKGVI